MQGVDVIRCTRVCACALVALTHVSTYLDYTHSPLHHWQLFAGPHAQVPSGKREETLNLSPAPIYVYGSERGKLWLCVPACSNMREHIAAAVLSVMCVLVWYIVERT